MHATPRAQELHAMLGPVRFEDKKGDGVPTDPAERVKASAHAMQLGPAVHRID